MARGTVGEDIEFPPGVSTNFGKPQNASGFIQAKLPGTWKWEGKRSRAVSFITAEVLGSRGTTKSKAQAIRAAASWCWSWWESLDDTQKSAVQASSKQVKRPAQEVASGSSDFKKKKQ